MAMNVRLSAAVVGIGLLVLAGCATSDSGAAPTIVQNPTTAPDLANDVATPTLDELYPGAIETTLARATSAADEPDIPHLPTVEVVTPLALATAPLLSEPQTGTQTLKFLESGGSTTPKLKWQRSLSKPAYADTYYTDPSSLALGKYAYAINKSCLCAFDKGTGALRWSIPLVASAWHSDLVVSGEVVLFATSEFRPHGPTPLYALDATTGHELWRVDAGEPFVAPLFISEGLAYFATVQAETDTPPAADKGGNVYAIEVATGKLRWTLAVPAGEALGVPSTDGGYIYFKGRERSGVEGSYLFEVDTRTQKADWIPLPVPITGTIGSLVVGGGTAYFTSTEQSGVYALDIKTRKEKWHTTGTWRAAVASWEMLILTGPSNNMPGSPGSHIGGYDTGFVLGAVDSLAGREKWVQPGGYVMTSVYAGGGTIYSASGRYGLGSGGYAQDAVLAAIDVVTGQSKWSAITDGAVTRSMASEAGVLYFGDEGGHIYAVQAGTP